MCVCVCVCVIIVVVWLSFGYWGCFLLLLFRRGGGGGGVRSSRTLSSCRLAGLKNNYKTKATWTPTPAIVLISEEKPGWIAALWDGPFQTDNEGSRKLRCSEQHGCHNKNAIIKWWPHRSLARLLFCWTNILLQRIGPPPPPPPLRNMFLGWHP